MLGILETISPSELVSNGYISNHNKVRRPRPNFKVSVYLYLCYFWINVTQVNVENIKRKIQRIISDSCFHLKSWFNIDARAPSIPLLNFPFNPFYLETHLKIDNLTKFNFICFIGCQYYSTGPRTTGRRDGYADSWGEHRKYRQFIGYWHGRYRYVMLILFCPTLAKGSKSHTWHVLLKIKMCLSFPLTSMEYHELPNISLSRMSVYA